MTSCYYYKEHCLSSDEKEINLLMVACALSVAVSLFA